MPTSRTSGIANKSQALLLASRTRRVSASMTRMASFAALTRLRYFSSELRICFRIAAESAMPINNSNPLATKVVIESNRLIQRAPSPSVAENSSSSGVSCVSMFRI